MQEEAIKIGWRRRIGWTLFILAVVLPVLYGVVTKTDLASMLGGRILGAVGIIGLIALAATRKRTDGRSYVVLAIGIVSMGWSLAGMFNLYGQSQDLQAAIENLKTAAAGAPSTAKARTVRIPLPENDIERSEDANIAIINDVADAHRSRFREYQQLAAQMNAVQVQGVLAPQNLLTAEGISASRAKIATYAQLQHQLVSLSIAEKSQVRAILDNSSASSQAIKDRIWAGFNETYGPQLERMQALDSVRQDTVRTVGGLLDLAQANLGRLQEKDGKLLFPDVASLQLYQRDMALLNQQAGREEQIMAAVRTQSLQAAANLAAANFGQ